MWQVRLALLAAVCGVLLLALAWWTMAADRPVPPAPLDGLSSVPAAAVTPVRTEPVHTHGTSSSGSDPADTRRAVAGPTSQPLSEEDARAISGFERALEPYSRDEYRKRRFGAFMGGYQSAVENMLNRPLRVEEARRAAPEIGPLEDELVEFHKHYQVLRRRSAQESIRLGHYEFVPYGDAGKGTLKEREKLVNEAGLLADIITDSPRGIRIVYISKESSPETYAARARLDALKDGYHAAIERFGHELLKTK